MKTETLGGAWPPGSANLVAAPTPCDTGRAASCRRWLPVRRSNRAAQVRWTPLVGQWDRKVSYAGYSLMGGNINKGMGAGEGACSRPARSGHREAACWD